MEMAVALAEREKEAAGQLTRIVLWAHQLVTEVLAPGDLAVDLTAGTGRDTLTLWQAVGAGGQVLAFDVQEAALAQSAARLRGAGAQVERHPAGADPADFGQGVHLLLAGHEQLAAHLPAAPRAVIANLGYLPGGDQTLTTQRDTTLAALGQALDALLPGGRLAVVVYPGHGAGHSEAQGVEALFRCLSASRWQVLRLSVPNKDGVPLLLVAERRD